jgi:hypothetical protein
MEKENTVETTLEKTLETRYQHITFVDLCAIAAMHAMLSRVGYYDNLSLDAYYCADQMQGMRDERNN